LSEAAAVDPGPPAAVTVGAQLRLLRRARRQTLRQVAQRARVSESFLSQLERGRTGASIASLQGIAAALGVEVSDLFARSGGTGPAVLRRDDRPYVSWGTLGRKALLTPKPFEALEVVAASFERGGSTGPDTYQHGDSEELLVVVAGVVELTLGDEAFRLGPGDTARYRSSTPHRLVNAGEETAEVMYIMSPPSY
jgi:transcriptional regulator with XRE-family HTH domain